MSPLAMPLYDPSLGAFGFVLMYLLCGLVWAYPLSRLLPKHGYSAWWALSAFAVGGLAALVAIWLIAFPEKWTPPEDNA
ncbi:hypothetical protein [Puniceibacterium sp. IMCC21224]|uniref:hypothetical protein n=1 Tax=Puniceibacterium sp. IMCC21224 TaxID=1618204 RepID=UPI00065D7BEC|nr:hypothetical protein [Puniceibacterium sp. IMCC21224]KMK67061.1 hypothetical protein IMCC21224_111924 [Puniceibacterium sp. IMCC21224]